MQKVMSDAHAKRCLLFVILLTAGALRPYNVVTLVQFWAHLLSCVQGIVIGIFFCRAWAFLRVDSA